MPSIYGVQHCELCGTEFDGESRAENRDLLKNHILRRHTDELWIVFHLTYDAKRCRNCTRSIHMDDKENEDFCCPHCGHDLSKWFAGTIAEGWNHYINDLILNPD